MLETQFSQLKRSLYYREILVMIYKLPWHLKKYSYQIIVIFLLLEKNMVSDANILDVLGQLNWDWEAEILFCDLEYVFQIISQIGLQHILIC